MTTAQSKGEDGECVALVHDGHDISGVMEGRWRAEAIALRSALSAATERAEAVGREAAKQIEVANVNWTLAQRLDAKLARYRSDRAAALTLAGEAVEQLGRLTLGGEHLGTYDGFRSRLASLSSPSAPESGNTEGNDG